MADIITGTFSADGDSVEFIARRFVVYLGTDSAEDFGGGTVEFKSKVHDAFDYTTDATTYTATDIIKQDNGLIGAKFKLTLTGATSPDIDYSILYE